MIHKIRRAIAIRARRRREPNGVTNEVFGNRHFAYDLVETQYVFASKQRLDGRRHARSGLRHDFDFIVLRQIIDHHIEHEAVQLRFRQRIRAFHLDGILRRQHEKWQRQYMADAACGHLIFLHRFQQRRLSLGRRAVDFVR